MTGPPLAVATVFLPRMEVDHLADWIGYHRNLGATHFFLFNNGHISHDSTFGRETAGRVWQKKPEADYRLDLSDEEVDRRVDRILAGAGPNVRQITWPGSGRRDGDFQLTQLAAINALLADLRGSGRVPWVAFIDVDELLVPAGGGLSAFLARVGDDVAAIRVSQKLFESRWRAGRGVPFRRLTRSFGLLDFNHKLIARVSRCRRWLTPHAMEVESGRVLDAPADELRFHHFRGNEHFGKKAPPGWGVHRYVSLESVVDVDSTHCGSLPPPDPGPPS